MLGCAALISAIAVAFDGEVADRDDTDCLASFADRQAPEGLVAHELESVLDAVVWGEGGQVTAADVAEAHFGLVGAGLRR